MGKMELKKICETKDLDTGNKDDMVKTLLKHEAKHREAAKAREAQIRVVLAGRRKELQALGIPELKELCEKRGLKLGGNKDDKVERLLNLAKDDGQVDKILAAQARVVRKEELTAMDKADLFKLCGKTGVDPLMKEVMVERILAAEIDGPLATGKDDAEPTKAMKGKRKAAPAKAMKARKAMKAK